MLTPKPEDRPSAEDCLSYSYFTFFLSESSNLKNEEEGKIDDPKSLNMILNLNDYNSQLI